MMKSTIKKRTFQAIYRLLDRVSPVDYDCGTMCGAACCGTPEDDWGDEGAERDMGIYLLPGEEKLHSKHDDWLTWTEERVEDYEFPESWSGKVYFVKCNEPPHCPRHKRPIQCRIFPVSPHLTEDGQLLLIWNDLELPYSCPLIDDEMKLEERFLRATYTVWKHLITDPLIRDLVEMDSEERMDAGAPIEQVWPAI